MKKLYMLLMIMIFSFTLYSCAAGGGYDVQITPSISGDTLSFDYRTLTYTTNKNNDILEIIGNPNEDFIIMYQQAKNEYFNDESLNLYHHMLNNLIQLSELESVNIGSLLDLSSTELNALMISHDISVTVDDIVIFNEMKAAKASAYQNYISKVTYINERLHIILSSDEINSLDLFQETYIDYLDYQTSFIIKDFTYEEIIEKYTSVGMNLSEDTLEDLKIAYDILILLYET